MVICPKMAQMAGLCFIFHFFGVSGNQSPKKKDTFLPYHTYLFGSSHFLCNFSCFLHFFCIFFDQNLVKLRQNLVKLSENLLKITPTKPFLERNTPLYG